jgi:copper chaperone
MMMTFTLPDMSCGHCVAAVTKALKAVDAAAEVRTDLASRTVTVATTASRGAVAKALADAGYPAGQA